MAAQAAGVRHRRYYQKRSCQRFLQKRLRHKAFKNPPTCARRYSFASARLARICTSPSCSAWLRRTTLLDALLEPLDLRVVVDDVRGLAFWPWCPRGRRHRRKRAGRLDAPADEAPAADAGAIAAVPCCGASFAASRKRHRRGGAHHGGQPLPQLETYLGHWQRHARAQAPGASCWRTCARTAW